MLGEGTQRQHALEDALEDREGGGQNITGSLGSVLGAQGKDLVGPRRERDVGKQGARVPV